VIIAPLFLKNALDEILSSQNLRFECKNPLNKVSFSLIKIDKKVENEYYRKQRERSANTRRFPKNQELLSKALDLFLPKIKSNARILDIGCGDGWGMSEMICRGYCNVAGIDIGEKTIEVAKSYGLEAKTEDMHKISFPDDSFDAIFCRHTLEHAHTPLIVLRHCQRILKNKGKIFLIVPVEKNVPFGHHYMRFNKEVIRCLFSQAGINIISLKEEPRELYVWGEVKKVDY
jgi:2-polyprenyl-3-methyl-5-hydroxy-6-metoxy-1,4-benzoquinol methylase